MAVNFEVVILAAGEAKRFGSPKQLATWKGAPLLQHAINLFQNINIKPWVALGAHRAKILSDKKLKIHGCNEIFVDDWRKGLSSSIIRSLHEVLACNRSLEGVFFLLADQPMISERDIAGLLELIQKNATSIVCSEYEDGVGVPAYFPSCYFKDLFLLEGDKGAKSIIEANPHVSVTMNFPLLDIDVPEDITRWDR